MNDTTTATLDNVTIRHEHLKSYRQHGARQTLRGAIKALDVIAADLAYLQMHGDSEAAAGATIALREALLDVAAIPCNVSEADHALKQKVIDARFDLVTAEAPWLTENMFVMAYRMERDAMDDIVG